MEKMCLKPRSEISQVLEYQTTRGIGFLIFGPDIEETDCPDAFSVSKCHLLTSNLLNLILVEGLF